MENITKVESVEKKERTPREYKPRREYSKDSRDTTVKAKSAEVSNEAKTESVAAPRSFRKFNNKANSAPKDFQSIKENIEAKINAFFETNKSAGFKKLVSVNKLMEAGAHIGLSNHLWNPKMKPFIYNRRGGKNQIIDILKTLVFLNRAYNFLFDITKQGGSVLFVGTHGDIIKEHIKEEAKRTKSYYINQRWLGGTLTNFKTITNSINKLNKLINLTLSEDINKYSKKEQLDINREIEKLTKFIGGIRTMRSLPQVLVVTDPVIEHNAITEARKLKVPVIAITNTNADPNLVDFIIPANSNSIKTVYLMISVLADAIAAAKDEPTKVVDKTDEEIVLPEIIKPVNRQVVDHRSRWEPRGERRYEQKTERVEPKFENKN